MKGALLEMKELKAEKKPFYKKFKTENFNYIYDVNTNDILRVSKPVYDIIDYIPGYEFLDDLCFTQIEKILIPTYSTIEAKECLDILMRNKKERRHLSAKRPQITSGIHSVEQVYEMMQSGLNQLIMEVTERCNLRCKYCVYSGKSRYTRAHGINDITFDTAIKAVDYFLKRAGHSHKKEKIGIIFYGGEPLLNVGILKRIVTYITTHYKDKDVFYSVITNGILLGRKSTIDFLISNNFFVTVSIDGPSHIHDRYRVCLNNKPTLKRIINNLRFIRKYNPGYYSNFFSINALMAPPFDIQAVSDFFYKNDLFTLVRERLNIRFISKKYTSFFNEYNILTGPKEIEDENNRLFSHFKDALSTGKYNELTLEKELFSKRFYDIASRRIVSLPDDYSPHGKCIPGKRKLFVDAGGDFYMCEKVNANYSIGNVNEGFNHKRILEFFQECDRIFADCNGCWALRLCDKCFNKIRIGDSFSIDRKNEFCRNSKEQILMDLLHFCEIIEKNKDAFSVFV
jgi:uncharacterized protein